MDVDEFMGFLEMRPKEERWHLIEGRAVMMSPPSLAHQRIALNLCELLNRGFVAQGSDLYAFHQIAIRLPGVVNFQPEPDVVVAPGTASYELYTEHFRLIGEIPSPSNTRREIDLKAAPLSRGAGQSLCRRDRAARASRGGSCEEPQLSAGDPSGGR
jgi:Uma2 family endonuclease